MSPLPHDIHTHIYMQPLSLLLLCLRAYHMNTDNNQSWIIHKNNLVVFVVGNSGSPLKSIGEQGESDGGKRPCVPTALGSALGFHFFVTWRYHAVSCFHPESREDKETAGQCPCTDTCEGKGVFGNNLIGFFSWVRQVLSHNRTLRYHCHGWVCKKKMVDCHPAWFTLFHGKWQVEHSLNRCLWLADLPTVCLYHSSTYTTISLSILLWQKSSSLCVILPHGTSSFKQ